MRVKSFTDLGAVKVTGYDGLYTDVDGRTWNILIREGGSISLYATCPGYSGHAVAYDTLDNKPPNPLAQQVIEHLSEMAEGINALLAAVNGASAD